MDIYVCSNTFHHDDNVDDDDDDEYFNENDNDNDDYVGGIRHRNIQTNKHSHTSAFTGKTTKFFNKISKKFNEKLNQQNENKWKTKKYVHISPIK